MVALVVLSVLVGRSGGVVRRCGGVVLRCGGVASRVRLRELDSDTHGVLHQLLARDQALLQHSLSELRNVGQCGAESRSGWTRTLVAASSA